MHEEYVRPAEIRDAHALAADMRPHDIEECRAFGREPLEALLFPFLARQQAFTITDEQDNVYAMFGVTDGITFGCPWMLTSNKFHKVANQLKPWQRILDQALLVTNRGGKPT